MHNLRNVWLTDKELGEAQNNFTHLPQFLHPHHWHLSICGAKSEELGLGLPLMGK